MWRGVWLIISASGEDDQSRHVRELGQRLLDATAHRDAAAVTATLAQMRSWLDHLAGVVCARLTGAFSRFQ